MTEAAASGPPLADRHDEAHLAAFERATGVWLGDLEMHRRNPLVHLSGLDLACYDRDYAPQRRAGRGAGPAPGRVAGRHRRGHGNSGPGQRAGRRRPRRRDPGAARGHPGGHRRERPGGRARGARAAGGAHRPGRRRGRPGPGAGLGGAHRADEQLRGHPGRPGPPGRAGRRRAGPAHRPARRQLRPGGPGRPPLEAGPGAGPRSPGRRRRHRGGAGLDAACHRVHQATATWCPITTANAGSGWRPSRGAGPWR